MREKVYLFIIGVFIGVFLGYAWRMMQVEPSYNSDIEVIHRNQKRIAKDIYNIELKIAIIEEQIRGISKKR